MDKVRVHNEEIEHLNLRSEEVREIMGHIPSRLIQYGISVVFIVVGLILAGTCRHTVGNDTSTGQIRLTDVL